MKAGPVWWASGNGDLRREKPLESGPSWRTGGRGEGGGVWSQLGQAPAPGVCTSLAAASQRREREDTPEPESSQTVS